MAETSIDAAFSSGTDWKAFKAFRELRFVIEVMMQWLCEEETTGSSAPIP